MTQNPGGVGNLSDLGNRERGDGLKKRRTAGTGKCERWMIKRPLNVQQRLEPNQFPENGENLKEGVSIACEKGAGRGRMDHDPMDHIMKQVRKMHFSCFCASGARLSQETNGSRWRNQDRGPQICFYWVTREGNANGRSVKSPENRAIQLLRKRRTVACRRCAIGRIAPMPQNRERMLGEFAKTGD